MLSISWKLSKLVVKGSSQFQYQITLYSFGCHQTLQTAFCDKKQVLCENQCGLIFPQNPEVVQCPPGACTHSISKKSLLFKDKIKRLFFFQFMSIFFKQLLSCQDIIIKLIQTLLLNKQDCWTFILAKKPCKKIYIYIYIKKQEFQNLIEEVRKQTQRS